MSGLVNGSLTENLLWNIERTFSKVYVPFMNSKAMADRSSEELLVKVKKELLPCLRSFARFILLLFHFCLNILMIVQFSSSSGDGLG